jgi:hypothetical protein
MAINESDKIFQHLNRQEQTWSIMARSKSKQRRVRMERRQKRKARAKRRKAALKQQKAAAPKS